MQLSSPASLPNTGLPTYTMTCPAHWYSAQLLHYGLKPSKYKATAKKHLLEALEAGRLEVPEHIPELEFQLREMYQVANEKAKAKYYEEKEERETKNIAAREEPE